MFRREVMRLVKIQVLVKVQESRGTHTFMTRKKEGTVSFTADLRKVTNQIMEESLWCVTERGRHGQPESRLRTRWRGLREAMERKSGTRLREGRLIV